jgi:hypothetical protein
MPAIGKETKRKYFEAEILDPNILGMMRVEVLSAEDDEESVVVPVRHATTPHFRTLARGAYRTRVGVTEKNTSHDDCIDVLKRRLTGKPVGLRTMVFASGNEHFVLLEPSKDSSYAWYKEARIPLEGGRYIQSDLCGRDTLAFSSGTTNPAIIIEVVQTHLPEQETFYALLNISKRNTFVGFYFIGPEREFSKFNSTKSIKKNDETVKVYLRFAYYLIDGVFYENGTPVDREAGIDDATWYQTLMADQFAHAMNRKAD